jgi:hypothetical protein
VHRARETLSSQNVTQVKRALRLSPPQQLWQLGEVRRHPPGLVAGEEVRRRATAGLVLEVDVGERLPVGIADDEAGVGFLSGPGRREAACGCSRSDCANTSVRLEIEAPTARTTVSNGEAAGVAGAAEHTAATAVAVRGGLKRKAGPPLGDPLAWLQTTRIPWRCSRCITISSAFIRR